MVGKSSEREDSLKRTRDQEFLLGRILHKLLKHSLGTGVIGAGRSGATHVALTRYPNIIYHTIDWRACNSGVTPVACAESEGWFVVGAGCGWALDSDHLNTSAQRGHGH